MDRGLSYLRGVTTLRFSPERCDGCGRCVEVCPHAVFALSGGRAAVVDADRCMECGACRLNCPRAAIEVTAGVGCAAALTRAMTSRGREAGCGCSGPCCR